MMSTASKLDAVKFGKVRRLMTEGATIGERAAAHARAEAMAKAAGMSLGEAMLEMDAKPAPQSNIRNFFEGFDDWMEEREPGHKARKAQERALKEARRKLDLANVIRTYGSEDAAFDETERERLLRIALEPLAVYSTYANAADLPPEHRRYISGYDGWTCREPTPRLWGALRSAYRLPEGLPAVWREWSEWERLIDDRCTVEPDYDAPRHVRARIAALEHLLDTMPDPTVEGIETRLRWLCYASTREVTRDLSEDRNLSNRLAADFRELAQDIVRERTRKSYGERKVSTVRRTNADKQADVQRLLRDQPELADREIARQCGVSPQTVGNWRRKKA